MPWTMLLRAMVRIAASMFAWRLATARRGAHATGQPGHRAQAAAARPQMSTRQATQRLRDAASLSWRLFSAGVLLVATALLITGGLTLTVLNPRWLGIALLTLGIAALAATGGELVAVRRLLASRRFRRRAESLRREVS